MKIILTEDQVNLIKMLNEQTEFVDKVKEHIKSLKENSNRIYNLITFVTIAEIRDGELDIPKMEQRIEKLDNEISNISRKVSEYYDRFPEEEYYAKRMDDIHLDLENRIGTVNKKIMALGDIISHLKPFAKVNEYGEGRDNDWDKPFDDVKPMNIE